MLEVTMVRNGEVHLMAPGLFSEDWPKPIIANAIDTIARDFAGSLAPLPSLNCSSRAMRTDWDKRRAMKKNKIGAYIWKISDLAATCCRVRPVFVVRLPAGVRRTGLRPAVPDDPALRTRWVATTSWTVSASAASSRRRGG
jgi:hypothetical protein